MLIERIIFLQGDQANEALDLYENKGPEGALQYLDQWYYPGEHETSDKPSAGSTDRVYEISDYLLTVNTSLGYIGLEYVLER
jgi:hypothetical protein